MMAATKGNYEATKMLLEADADSSISIQLTEEKDGVIEKITPLTMATSGSFTNIVKLLEKYVDL